MLAALVASVVGFLPFDEAAKNELAAAAKKLEAAQSYHFDYATAGGRGAKEEGGEAGDAAPAGGEGEAGKGRARDGEGWQIDFQRGKPLHLRHREAEFFRSEKKVAMLDPKSKQWTSVSRGAAPAPAAAEGAEKAPPMLGRMAVEIDRILFPHQLVKELGKKIGDVTRSEKDGAVTYVATLNKDVARELVGAPNDRGARREGGKREGGKREGGKREGGEGGKGEAGEAPEPKGEGAARELDCEGKMTAVASNGQITTIEIEITVKGPQPRVVRRSMKLSGIDATAVAAPAEAIAVLDI